METKKRPYVIGVGLGKSKSGATTIVKLLADYLVSCQNKKVVVFDGNSSNPGLLHQRNVERTRRARMLPAPENSEQSVLYEIKKIPMVYYLLSDHSFLDTEVDYNIIDLGSNFSSPASWKLAHECDLILSPLSSNSSVYVSPLMIETIEAFCNSTPKDVQEEGIDPLQKNKIRFIWNMVGMYSTTLTRAIDHRILQSLQKLGEGQYLTQTVDASPFLCDSVASILESGYKVSTLDSFFNKPSTTSKEKWDKIVGQLKALFEETLKLISLGATANANNKTH